MIQISEKASMKISDMMTEDPQNNRFLRLGVEDGGCSGLSYLLAFDAEQSDKDLLIDKDPLKVLIDKNSERFVRGVNIDYKDNPMGGGFTIDNPNARATCGCGSSFRTVDYRGHAKKCD